MFSFEALSPTSVTEAVTAKIVDALFTGTIIEAMKFAIPLFI